MKAIIKVGGKQYIVAENDTILVDKLTSDDKELKLDALMVFSDDSATVGTPLVKGASVTATVTDAEVKGDKIMVGKFQSKKRVKTINGHRQKHTRLTITKVSA